MAHLPPAQWRPTLIIIFASSLLLFLFLFLFFWMFFLPNQFRLALLGGDVNPRVFCLQLSLSCYWDRMKFSFCINEFERLTPLHSPPPFCLYMVSLKVCFAYLTHRGGLLISVCRKSCTAHFSNLLISILFRAPIALASESMPWCSVLFLSFHNFLTASFEPSSFVFHACRLPSQVVALSSREVLSSSPRESFHANIDNLKKNAWPHFLFSFVLL